MRLFRSIKGLFAIQAAALLLLATAGYFGVIDFHFDRFVANDPLLHPVRVSSYDATSITLEDGRTLIYDGAWIDLQPGAANPRIDVIDLEPATDSEMVDVYVSMRIECCVPGKPGVITIPLIPRDRNNNYRGSAGKAKVVSANDSE